MDKEIQKLIKRLRKQGFEVDERPRHPAVYWDGRRIDTLPGTPGDRRALSNVESRLRKYGYKRNA